MTHLDVSKAVDCVWHKGLLAKLPMFGHHHTLIKLIAVREDGFLSNLHLINAGVPQGSVIFPALFLLLSKHQFSSTSSSIHSFADDNYLSSVFSFDSYDYTYGDIPLQRSTTASRFNNDLTVIEKWGEDHLVLSN